jgi:uncharacterized protein (TIGR02147 family)
LKKKLSVLKPLEVKRVAFDKILAKPLTMILFIMVERSDLNNVKKITPDIFINKYDDNTIKESLNYLKEMNLISIDAEGNIVKLIDSLMSTNDIPSALIRQYHKDIMQDATHVIDDIDSSLREFQSYIININSTDMRKAKDLIRTFMSDFAKQMSDGKAEIDSTYSLNIQFFPTVRSSK